MNTTTITNATNGVIIRITTIPHDHFNYKLLVLALIAFSLMAVGLRQLFFHKDSN